MAHHKAKGAFLIIDGQLRQNTWERDGQRHSRLLVVADQVSFGPSLGSGHAGEPGGPPDGDDKDDLPF